ncbi:MAG: hypothetical protein ACP5E4_00025 [Candidatus Aenigmatarchaeota archaeon]
MHRSLLAAAFAILAIFPVYGASVELWSEPEYRGYNQLMEIYANISGNNITSVYINLTTPYGENLSYPMALLDNITYSHNYLIGSNESCLGTYIYFVSFIENGTPQASGNASFLALDPFVLVWANQVYGYYGDDILFYANISGVNISNVSLNLTTPFGGNEVYPMSEANSTYHYNYHIPYNDSYYGTCTYLVRFLDEGYPFVSEDGYFYMLGDPILIENVTINVQVIATCMANIVRFIPFEVQHFYHQNVTIPILVYFENTGNIVISEKMFYTWVEDKEGTEIWSDSGVGYPDRDIPVGDFGFYWNIWSIGLTPFGNYTAVAMVEYASRLSGEQSTLPLATLTANYNCTNSGENWTCVSERTVTSAQYTMSEYCINTNITSNSTVSGIKDGTVGYEGRGTVNGTAYRAFSFELESCEGYCYACMSRDLASENVTLEEGDCAFTNTRLENFSYFVENISDNGSWADFGIRVDIGRYIRVTYDCVILGDNETLNCTVDIDCRGAVQRREDFEIVNITTILPTPIPQPYPQIVPTPEPEPEPQPQPRPEPEPEPEEAEIAIDIKPINRTVTGEQGTWIPSVFNVTNIGNMNVSNISLVPVVPEGWEVQDALIDFLDVNMSVNRTIFIKPPFTAFGQYVIPVKAIVDNVTLDMDYFWVNVLEGANRTRLEIIEIPRELKLDVSSEGSFPILVKNTGRLPLHNIKLRLENSEQCLEGFNFTEIDALNESEIRSMLVGVRTKKIPATCNTTVIIWSDEGAYAFSHITIFTIPKIMSPPVPWAVLLAFICIFLEMLLLHHKKKKEERDEPTYITDFMIILVLLVLLASIGLIFSDFMKIRG